MARIAGVDIPRNKRVEIALTYIYGIGKPTSQKILTEAGINFDTRVKDLTEEEVNKIRAIVETIKVEGDLRKEVRLYKKTYGYQMLQRIKTQNESTCKRTKFKN